MTVDEQLLSRPGGVAFVGAFVVPRLTFAVAPTADSLKCAPPPNTTADGHGCCFRGPSNPDLRSFPAETASGCCGAICAHTAPDLASIPWRHPIGGWWGMRHVAPCLAEAACVGYTWNSADGGSCFLKVTPASPPYQSLWSTFRKTLLILAQL